MSISTDEQTRRRKVVESARWSNRMEGHGMPFLERVALDELWITGQITREERDRRLQDFLKAWLAAHGH